MPGDVAGPDRQVLDAVARAEEAIQQLLGALDERSVSPAELPDGVENFAALVEAVGVAAALAESGYFASCPSEAEVYSAALEYAVSSLRLGQRVLEAAPAPVRVVA